jgi:hypothetical protein
MSTLTDTYIDDTYDGAIHADGPLPSTGVGQLYDGIGTKASLSIGADGNGINVTGNILNNGVSIMDLIYPVGSVYFSMDATIPALFSASGTWISLAAGRFIVGVGGYTDSNGEFKNFGAGNNAGEYSHQLSTSELPSHKHSVTYGVVSQGGVGSTGNPNVLVSTKGLASAEGESADASLHISYAGGGTRHNNITPSFGLFVFQRTA